MNKFLVFTNEEFNRLTKLMTVAGIGMGAVFINSKLKKKNIILVWLDKTDYDGWTFAHFLIHMAIGYSFPYKLYISPIWGYLWEQVERKVGQKDTYWLDDSKYDYIINTLGAITGAIFAIFL